MSKFIKHNNNFCNKQCFNSYNSKNNIENNQLKNKIIKWNLQMVKDFVEENSNCKVISDTYINGASNMEFECRCGNKFITSFFKDNELKCLIEFDGEQHFAVVDFFGKETGFAERVYNDAIKNAYCEDNNINLLRIPYWELKNIENILNTNLL